jgi:D-alanyl-D-alanine carboxypeptidase
VSTTTDLNRFYGALLGGRLLPPAQLAQMKAIFPDGGDYGMGLLRVQPTGAQPLWGHTGSIFGYTAIALGTEDGRERISISINPWGEGDLFPPLERLLATAFPVGG